MKKLASLSVVLAVVSLASAQSDGDYEGRWAATFGGGKHEMPVAAELVVVGNGGTWKEFLGDRKAKNHPCMGRDFSVTVQQSTQANLVFSVASSKSIPGCKDHAAKLTRVDERTLEGEFDDGRALRLVRSK